MFKFFLISLFSVFFCYTHSFAGDFQWSGTYRIEGYQISNSDLNDQKREKSYGLHHLVLRPRIEAADGVTIRSRFDIFSNANYPNSQLGTVMGSGVGDGVTTPTSTNNSNVASQNQKADELKVTELYLTLVQEFGALVVGRTPLHFGLGMVHNAGKGPFDHWIDTRDLVGYKIVMGNLFLLPMYGKVSEKTLNTSDDVTDVLIQLQYESPDSGTEMGVFYQSRTANVGGSDFPKKSPTDFIVGGAGATADRHDTKTISFYGLKDTPTFRFGLEASWQEGHLGVRTQAGQPVEYSGYGVASELEFRPQTSKFRFGVKTGFASGDNPETDDKFEGFIFDRNYDVAFLLFNHTLGQKNFLRTEYVGTPNTDGVATTTHDQPDIEAISNVFYFAPHLSYKWNDRWALEAVLATGWLQTDPILNEVIDQSLGYELDLYFNFKPNNNITWVNGIGLLFPGTAFEGGASNSFSTDFAYGLVSKAAISF